MKLIEGNKDFLIINIKTEKGLVSYNFTYNENVKFKISQFRDKILYNRDTKEQKKYSELIFMRDEKDSTGLYLYPNTIVDLNSVYNHYHIDRWVFLDSSEYASLKEVDSVDDIKKTVEGLQQNISLINDILKTTLGDKGFLSKLMEISQKVDQLMAEYPFGGQHIDRVKTQHLDATIQSNTQYPLTNTIPTPMQPQENSIFKKMY